MRTTILVLLAGCCLLAGEPEFPRLPGLSPDERTVLTSYIANATAYAEALTAGKVRKQRDESPEMFAWVELPSLAGLLDAYELTGDVAHLDRFREGMQLILDLLEPGDDGHLGWWGKPIPPRRQADRPDLRIDELQMNFRAMAVLARWVELAGRDATYAAAQAATSARHLALLREHLLPKWDARGFFADLGGSGGTYRGLDYPLSDREHPGVTLSFEKLSIAVDGLLAMHRATGDAAPLRRAIQLGARFKGCLSLDDGRYAWMSWDPAGAWDADAAKPDAWRIGWIAPDPKGEWYAAAVSIAVNLYHHGLVFDDEDLARFIATQKTRCWNGDLEAPAYRTVNGVGSADNKHIQGRFLSHLLALHDADLSRLAFAGPHEAEVLAQSQHPWKGLVGLSPYIRAKFLLRPAMAAGARPFAAVGERFLADPAQHAFHDALSGAVTPPGRVTPLKPSHLPR